MLTFARITSSTTMQTLREGIRRRYTGYHLRDRDRYPEFDFNSNRANYQPLRDSFEEEFYEVRKIDRASPNVFIPSTNTLALIFTDDTYVPSTKILNTCQSYALGPAKSSISTDVPARSPEQPSGNKRLLFGGLGLLFCLGILVLFNRSWPGPAPSGLVISRPSPKSVVLQEVVVAGKVANATTVWIAVRSKINGLVWIQPPILVQDNGDWIGVIYVGNPSKKSEGYTYQVRAFVSPFDKLISGEVLSDWPEAELSSPIVDVLRGANH